MGDDISFPHNHDCIDMFMYCKWSKTGWEYKQTHYCEGQYHSWDNAVKIL